MSFGRGQASRDYLTGQWVTKYLHPMLPLFFSSYQRACYINARENIRSVLVKCIKSLESESLTQQTDLGETLSTAHRGVNSVVKHQYVDRGQHSEAPLKGVAWQVIDAQ